MTEHKIEIDTGEINPDKEDFDNAVTLKEYLDTHTHKGFIPKPRYYELGDYLTHFAKEDRCVGKNIDEFLTVYTSIEDGSIVGVKIKNVKQAISVGPSP